MQQEPTNAQLLNAIISFKTELLGEIGEVRGEVGEVRGEVAEVRGEVAEVRGELIEALQDFATQVDTRFNQVDNRFTYVEKEIGNIRNTMVTKAYLDDRLADEGVRYGGLIRETNVILGNLADELVTQDSLSRPAAARIKAKRPFFKKARAS